MSSSNAGEPTLKPEGSYSQAKTLESEYSRQRAALTHAGGRLSLTDLKLNLNLLLLKFAIYLLLLPFGLYLTQTMALASGPFPVVKTKKWIFDSVEAPTIYHSISTPSRYSPSRFFFMPTIFMSLILSLTRLVPRPKSQAPLSKAQYFDLNTLRPLYKIMCQSRPIKTRPCPHSATPYGEALLFTLLIRVR